MRCLHLIVASIALAILVGCGGSKGPVKAPVSGKITLDGKPLQGASVNFDLKAGKSSHAATGTTDAEGRYQLSTTGQNDGAVVGRHVVWVTMPQKGEAISPDNPTADYGKMMAGAAAGAKPDTGGIPAKYTAKETSDLSYEVKPGKNENVDFDLK